MTPFPAMRDSKISDFSALRWPKTHLSQRLGRPQAQNGEFFNGSYSLC
jgi:hypothetical protein